jgi:hypothetical protein
MFEERQGVYSALAAKVWRDRRDSLTAIAARNMSSYKSTLNTVCFELTQTDVFVVSQHRPWITKKDKREAQT